MLYINRNSTNPYFNLAAEEYVLKNFDDDCFMLWQNKASIIVGKHQNALAEINYQYVTENDIPVIRRISGGGTVFHDLGNLNFTFVQNEKEEHQVNFRKYTKPIIDALRSMGVDARFEGRNDIKVNGKKISGNAEHVFKNRTLHHGTLLFSSKLSDLSQALKIEKGVFRDKAVKSVRSEVANFNEFLKEDIDILDFKNRIKNFVSKQFSGTETYKFNQTDIDTINKLVKEKYGTWKWNFGYSPKYSFSKIIKSANKKPNINIEVKEGIIREFHISGEENMNEFGQNLIGLPHEEKPIAKKLNTIDFNKYFRQISKEELIKGMF